MIEFDDGVFMLNTVNTSYIFRITETGHLEHLYFGARIKRQDYNALKTKTETMTGSTVAYNEHSAFSLDTIDLEYSGIGKGDYRLTPLEVKMPDKSFVSDFVYSSHGIVSGSVESALLPTAHDGGETLTVVLKDISADAELKLLYTVFEECDVVSRRAVLVNNNKNPLVLRKFMSFCLDLSGADFELATFNGGWIKEAHKTTRKLSVGTYINESTTGNSSNRANPAFMLYRSSTSEDAGEAYGFNLVYSGNHYSAVSVSPHMQTRVMSGINPHCFEWELNKGESFETPEAVLSYSESGFNGLSRNMHNFIKKKIVRGKYADADRPVLLNNWEAHFFDFNYRKLVNLAKGAKKIGAEMFVLDDGWFGSRNSDRAGLGDWKVNKKKLPGGLKRLCGRLKKMGLEFGLWFEPEMVNPDSDLFRAHPEYAVKVPGRVPSYGRNQLALDLNRADVRDYIVTAVNSILSSCSISYVKWDMNRHLSDMYSETLNNQGKFFHGYILGLYDILRRIVYANSDVLFESCASGGNRFDLGMLCFTPQIWASDNTDPIERLKIQGGLSYMYPQSVVGAHVSMSPHQQTLRHTPLSTRFNVAAFGLLGYELDLAELNGAEKREIAAQIKLYKERRRLFQYGDFYRFEADAPNRVVWQVSSGDKSVLGNFQTYCTASPPDESLRVKGLEGGQKYCLQTVPQTISIKAFGGLIKHALPLKVKPDGFVVRLVDKFYRLPDATEKYINYGDLLSKGVKIKKQFMGTYYNSDTRLLSDFGSQLYTVDKV